MGIYRRSLREKRGQEKNFWFSCKAGLYSVPIRVLLKQTKGATSPEQKPQRKAETMNKAFIKKVIRFARISDSVKAKGVEIKHERKLVKMTNVQMNYGRLIDAKCYYQRRWTITGNTYPIRQLLKGYGFRWDAATKSWWIKAADLGDNLKQLEEGICRELAA